MSDYMPTVITNLPPPWPSLSTLTLASCVLIKLAVTGPGIDELIRLGDVVVRVLSEWVSEVTQQILMV